MKEVLLIDETLKKANPYILISILGVIILGIIIYIKYNKNDE